MENEKQYLSKLVRQYQQGDQSAFNEIYSLTYDKAYFTALKICKNEDDAEDVLQEAFVYFSMKAKEIKNPDAFMSWFNTVVASRAKNLLRKNNPLLFSSDEEESFVIDSIKDDDEDYHPGKDVEQSELQSDVMELVDGLNDEKRTAIILFYYNEMTTREIAESLGVNENTVKSRLVQAKKDLAKGVDGLKKKNRSLYSVAPMPLVIWALKGSAKSTGEAFAASGGAAATLAAVTEATGTAAGAAAGTTAAVSTGGIAAKIAGLTVAQKVIAGVVTTGIIVSGAVGAKTVSDRKKVESANAGTGNTEYTAQISAENVTASEKLSEIEKTSGASKVEASAAENTTEQADEVQSEVSTKSEKSQTSTTKKSDKTKSASETAGKSTMKSTAKVTTAKVTTAKVTTTKVIATTLGKSNLRVTWKSFSGDGKSGSYTVTVDKGTVITQSMITEQLPSGYSESDIISGNGNIGQKADSSDYNFEIYVY